MQELGKLKLQDNSVGMLTILFTRNLVVFHCATILAINTLLSKMIKLPTTTVLKLDFA